MRTLPERPKGALLFPAKAASGFFRPDAASARLRWVQLGPPLVMILLSFASFAVAILILFWRWRGASASVLQLPSAAALMANGVVQLRLVTRRRRNRMSRGAPWLSPLTWTGAMLVGLLCCYGLSLALGPKHAAGCVFAATAMTWATLLSLPFSASADDIDRLRRMVERRGTRRCYQSMCVVSLTLLLGEGAVRAGAWLLGPEHFEPAKQVFVQRVKPVSPPATLASLDAIETAGATAPQSSIPQNMVNAEPRTMLVKWAANGDGGRGREDQAPETRLGQPHYDESRQRMVILGDRLPDNRRDASGEGLLPSAPTDAHVFYVQIPEGGLSDYVRQGLPRVSSLRPKLLLVFFSVADDLVAEEKRRSPFDWRSLSAPRAIARWTGWPESKNSDPLSDFAASVNQPAVGRWEDYVAACSPQVATCRKPVDATMQRRWKSTFVCFGELERACREANIRLGLIVAPSPLQTNRALLEAVCRRQGLSIGDVDLELPQRRLAAYAAERKLATLDLLPALRQSSEPVYAHQGWEWSDAAQAIISQSLDDWVGATFNDAFESARPQVATAWHKGEQGRLVSH